MASGRSSKIEGMVTQAQDSPQNSALTAPKWWPILCLLPFLGWWLTGLTDLDEGFYGAIARDMMLRGDFITPTLNGVPWFEKPILVYWLAIPAINAFGLEWGPKLPSVLATLLTAWLLYWFASKWFGKGQGILAALAFSSSVLAVAVGRMMLTDAAFVAAMTGCFLLFWESINGRPVLRWGAAACLGLAVLAKSPVAGVFFIATAFSVYARFPDLRKGFKGHWVGPVLLGLGVIASWYVPCWLANGQIFVKQYLIEQNLGRFAGGDLAHKVPVFLHPIYFPIVLAVGLLPWLPGAIRQGLFRRESAESKDQALVYFLWAWTLSVLILFSISGSKLPHYIAPALPPLMLLTARSVMKKPGAEIGKLIPLAAGWSIFICLLANGAFYYEYGRQKGPELHGLARVLSGRQEPLVFYRFGRDSRDVQMSFTINETSRPSLFFYLGRRAKQTGDIMEAIRDESEEFLLVAPAGRLSKEEISQVRDQGFVVEPSDLSTRNYQVFRFTPVAVHKASTH